MNFDELIEEFGRLQYEAGRLSAQIEHSYRMALILKESPHPDPETIIRAPRRRSEHSKLIAILKVLARIGPSNIKTLHEKCSEYGIDVTRAQVDSAISHAHKSGRIDRVNIGVYQVRDNSEEHTVKPVTE